MGALEIRHSHHWLLCLVSLNKMVSNVVSYSDHLGTGPYPGEFRGRYSRDQYSRSASLGRSASVGRRESDRSLEERYGPGYTGEKVSISDFFRHGRERYARAGYGKGENFRRSPAARSQSIARLDNQRFAEDRYTSQPRFEDCYERYPREYQRGDRFARDCPEDRYTYGRQYDDRSMYDSDRYMSARPGYDRYMSDRPGYDRYPVDRMPHDKFAAERRGRSGDRMPIQRFPDRCDNEDRFSRERNQRDRYGNVRNVEHQRYGNERHVERFSPNRYDRSMDRNQKYGDERSQKQERFSNEERRYGSDGEKRANERFAEERRMSGDRRTSLVKPVTDRFQAERPTGDRKESFSAESGRWSSAANVLPNYN